MTVQTQTLWDNPIAQATLDDCKIKLASMEAAGQTSGTETAIPMPHGQQGTVIRSWTDTAAAQEWIDFIQPYGPVSAEIVV